MNMNTVRPSRICPVCGRVSTRIVGPPQTEMYGGMYGSPVEEKITEWLCAYSVGEDVYIIEHTGQK